MPGIFDNYKIALLDSSFFKSNFSKDVKNGLNNVKVYVADTFGCEIKQYMALLSSQRQQGFESNIRFLREKIELYTIDRDSFGKHVKHLHNDTWAGITLFAGLHAKFVVITANQLLIQRIVLGGLKADIYDLDTNKFIRFSEFSLYQSEFELQKKIWETKSPLAMDTIITENTILYRRNGLTATLDKKINEGMEAELYLVKGTSLFIAKIFKEDELSTSKFQNIKHLLGINEMLDVDWAIFPIELLYYDPDCKVPVGFLEAYVSAEVNLSENPLFLGNPNEMCKEHFLVKQSEVVELCLKIVRQVCYLNIYGFYISDYNLENFAIIRNNKKNIQMWDTDSFGYGAFFADVYSPEYVERKNPPRYDTETKQGVIGISNDALYQFIFRLLSAGDIPFNEDTEKFKYDDPKYRAIGKKKFFPQNVWKLMEDVFRENKIPSAEELMYQLYIANESFRENPVSNKSYGQLFKEKQETVSTEFRINNIDISDYLYDYYIEDEEKISNISFVSKDDETLDNNSISISTNSVSVNENIIKKKSKLKIMISILIAIAILGIGGYYISATYGDGKYAELEKKEYIGWLKADAAADIKAAGWKVEFEKVNSWYIEKGYVVTNEYNKKSKIVTLGISQGPAKPDNIKSAGRAISVDIEKIVLPEGVSASFTVRASDDRPEDFYFQIQRATDIDISWGEWLDDYSARIVVKATSVDDTGYVRIFIGDGKSEEDIGYTDVFISVQKKGE